MPTKYKILSVIAGAIAAFGFAAAPALAYTGTQVSATYSGGVFTLPSANSLYAGASWLMSDDPPNNSWGQYGSGCRTAVSDTSMNIAASTCFGQGYQTTDPKYYLLQVYGTGNPFTDPLYYVKFTIDSSGNVVVNNPVGPPAPSATNPTATQVIRITQPGLYASTTVPFDIHFDAYISTAASTTDGYQLKFTDDNTGVVSIFYGLLTPGFPLDTPFRDATTSVSVPAGTYTLQMMLGGGTADKIASPGLPWYGNGWSTATHFSVGVPYNSSKNYTTQGIPDSTAYSSSDCAVNFLGTFSIPGCVGYLITPASTTIQDFSQLTLANSFPFAYGYDMLRIREELFTASSTASSSLTVTLPGFGPFTFISSTMIAAVPYAPLVKTVLGIVMWLLVIELVYRQVIRSHNQNTGV